MRTEFDKISSEIVARSLCQIQTQTRRIESLLRTKNGLDNGVHFTRTRKSGNGEVDNDALYQEIGRLKVELDWLKKKAGMLD